MQEIQIVSLTAGLVAVIISFLITPVVIKITWFFGLVDDPKKNPHPKVIHTRPIPRGGGLVIFAAILIATVLYLPLDKYLISILLGAAFITIYGLADDKWNLNPYLRLALQFVAAGIPIAAGVGIAFVSNPFGGIINLSALTSAIFALFWIVILMNFLNMGAKGVPGQLPGVTAIAAVTIAILSLKFSADITQWPVIVLASITAGAFLGFLPWNFHPQKIMPSFSGSNLAGYFLGVLSILATTKVGLLTIVLGVPIIDTGYTVIRRVVSGKSPVWGDRLHLHHRLLDIGWSQKRVAVFYWLVTLILGLLAFNLNTQTKLYTIIGIALFVGGLILWLTYLTKRKS